MSDTDTQPTPRDYQATEAAHLIEAALSRTPDQMFSKPPGADDHRRTVLTFVARAWDTQQAMTLGGLLKRAAEQVGADLDRVDDLALLVGLGLVAKPDPYNEPF